MIQQPQLTDSFGRVMRDLRISVTDRCNFRCLYCLPESEEAAVFYRNSKSNGPVHTDRPIEHSWLPRSTLLSYEEIDWIVESFVNLGIEKVRITGGEPLLRRDLEVLIAKIARHHQVKDLAMTTNGFAFFSKAEALKRAGLKRVSFSLDSLNPGNFRKMTGKDALEQVLKGIDIAIELGFHPIKVNAVVIRGMNEHEIVDLVRFALSKGVHMRFIEFMPLDSGKKWMLERVVPGREILDRVSKDFSLAPAQQKNPSSTAKTWRIDGSSVELGIIAPVTEPFCGFCNRLRLTADGMMRTCLFSLNEHDLKSLIRNKISMDEWVDKIREIVWGKEEGHQIGKQGFQQPKRTMSCIGG